MQNLILYIVATVIFIAIILQLVRIFYFKNRKEKSQQFSLSIPIAIDNNDPVEIFAGTAMECVLVQSLLENAAIKAYIFNSGGGSLALGDSMLNQVMVSSTDFKKGKEVVGQYYVAIRKGESSDSSEIEELADSTGNEKLADSTGNEELAKKPSIIIDYETFSFLSMIIDTVEKNYSHTTKSTEIGCIDKECKGKIAIQLDLTEETINWQCPTCGEAGKITGWQKTKWDNRQ
jgi:predicted RNA-binding Zn-ribbon protein involved in translation (DUF1610 family)